MLIQAVTMFFLGFLLQKAIAPIVLNFLNRNALSQVNYQGKQVVTGAGLTIYSTFFVVTVVSTLANIITTQPITFLFGCTVIVMVGLLDDIWGNHDVKGLRGHFNSLMAGQLTTGGIKALVGFCLSILISRQLSYNLFDLIMNTLLLSLMINASNLMDLRPGRAMKFFLLGSLFLLIRYISVDEILWLIVIWGAVIAYGPNELSCKSMLGDAGANLLGFALGYYIVALTPILTKAVILTLLTILHWYSERHSLTKIIEKVRFLNYIDRLGRPEI